MDVYSKNGDRGTTELVHSRNVSKADDRIRLLGSLEELICHLNLFSRRLKDEDRQTLKSIREALQKIMDGIRDPYRHECRLAEDSTELLEAEILRMQSDHSDREIGENGLQILLARAVCRRAESDLASVAVKFGADHNAKKYMNRLSDYLELLANTAEDIAEPVCTDTIAAEQRMERKDIDMQQSREASTEINTPDEHVIQEVLRRIGVPQRLTLEQAKRLIEEIEQESLRRGMRSVIAVCDASGNPMAVHVMDGAFLVSFDVALKKAYSSVAVKMSTKELAKLAQPGETFYGVDKMGDGRMTIVAGGVPLFAGDVLIGGLGVSGGTGEQDHSLAEYGLERLKTMLQ